MLSLAHELQVLDAVILLVLVDVVDYLAWLQTPAKVLLHYVDVLLGSAAFAVIPYLAFDVASLIHPPYRPGLLVMPAVVFP